MNTFQKTILEVILKSQLEIENAVMYKLISIKSKALDIGSTDIQWSINNISVTNVKIKEIERQIKSLEEVEK